MDVNNEIKLDVINQIRNNRIELAQEKIEPYVYYKEDNRRFTNIVRRNKKNELEYQAGRISYDTYLIHDNKIQDAFVDLVDDIFNASINHIKIDDFLKEGDAYMEEEKFEKAVIAYKKVLEILPRHIKGNLEIGVAYTNISMFDNAIYHFTEVINKYPNPRALLNRGNIYYMLQKQEDACKDWKKVKLEGFSYADELLNKYCTNQLT